VFARQGIVEFKIEVLIKEKAKIRVLKELNLVIRLEILRERGIKEFEV
jgi:hypothetical protein